mmetsp:Transcript_6435/g.14034  ORF Transcript_6435/g.14034 Transcript_6435/m.14034 type:complete len:499 (-) Transcript_6435:41-1537(-)|eukprot:CAMPEP_0196144192 /NCGR_PEP_ID=MMETSP0910-20130528/15452_1 /TAXON_ID=49265 /ORGANISM="Thalassiosira rotula, Strain GSO102" /LENGTH=498 /DNA_ID=CAMNT_0041405791 /DNA_START=415 /DNA_END=1911 /DNA_ORIENTATION=-
MGGALPLQDDDETDPTIQSSSPTVVPDKAVVNSPLATAAGMAGNVLEWYDFALFGFFSDIIAQVFFPPISSDSSNSSMYGGELAAFGNLTRSFAVYGGAFLMRPVGGLLLGYFGDKHGRKTALVPSLFLMAFPTFLMGCLPTYEQVGGWSTALLVLCRLMQGMSVGGQLPASLVYTVESRPKDEWGYYGSLVMMAANVGTMLGNLFGALLRTVLTRDQLVRWGWRIPFWSGIANAFVAVFLHYYGEEYHPNAGEYDDTGAGRRGKEEEAPVQNPLRQVFRRENLPMLLSIAMTSSLWGAGFYTSFVWMATYMKVLIDPPREHGFWINAMALLFGIVLVLPNAGRLSDRTGRLRNMIAGAVCVGIVGPLMLTVISKGTGVQAFFAQWCIGVFLSLFGGPMNAWLVEQFPAKYRLTSVAVGYDLAHCTASAFSPLIATVLFQNYGPLAPGIIYPVFAAISLIGMFLSTKFRYCEDAENVSNVEPLLSEEDRASLHITQNI